jgi:hypothetical protein
MNHCNFLNVLISAPFPINTQSEFGNFVECWRYLLADSISSARRMTIVFVSLRCGYEPIIICFLCDILVVSGIAGIGTASLNLNTALHLEKRVSTGEMLSPGVLKIFFHQ